MRLIMTLLMMTTLAGCIANRPISPFTSTDPYHASRTFKTYLGIPFLLAIEGSYVRLDADWVITVKHNAPIFFYRETYKHPTCDLMLVKLPTDKAVEPIVIGKLFEQQEVELTGYPLGYPLTTTRGVYQLDAVFSNQPDCAASVGSFPFMSGMSGGGVWRGSTLVGVGQGFYFSELETDKHYSKFPGVIAPLYFENGWIEQITGRSYIEIENSTEATNP
ncbi:hypothetical protein [Vibrio mediterranei]|uniref:hypothetical protein n=1 Tax=Vibrio mediterranei TaxID=689 RepID=UPI00406922DB